MKKSAMAITLFVILNIMSGCSTCCSNNFGECFMGYDGATLNVDKGKTFTIVLDGNITTGYDWSIKPYDTQKLKLVDNAYKANHEKGMVGVGGERYFVFRALETGKVNLEFEYSRSWEKNKEPEQTKRYIIDIK